jgi:hypothetical protein
MKLRIWIPCILLIVILILFLRNYFTEGFQVSPTYSPPPPQSTEQTRTNFWSILAQEKAGSASGSKYGSGSAALPISSLLPLVMNPKDNDTFKMVYPKYISMYALAKYNYDPAVARLALINNFDQLQIELQTSVEQETDTRNKFQANPAFESCSRLNTLTMSFYGKLLSLYSSAQDLSTAGDVADLLHNENIYLQKAVSSGNTSACTGQGATPSADCIKLATMDETLFPLLPTFDTMNMELLTRGQDIQEIINLLLQAYIGIGCSMRSGSAAESNPVLTIDTVFSDSYLNSLPTVDTESLALSLQNLSPYYISPNIINFISKKMTGGVTLNVDTSSATDYIADISQITNSIVALNSDAAPIGAGQFFNAAGPNGGFTNCPPGYYCPPTSPLPVQCPVGSWCPGFNILGNPTDSPIPCSPSLPFSPPGASSESQCSTSAPIGYYIDDTTGNAVQCPTGHWCKDGVRNLCPTGTYNMKTGMGSQDSCLLCPKGSYCTSSTSITPCPLGSYNPNTGSSTSDACMRCPSGTYCSKKGLVTPVPCPAGTYSSTIGLQKECTAVIGGYYLVGTGNTSDTTKQACAAGYFCPAGSANQLLCPIGSYCDTVQLVTPKLCAAGTYGSTSGLQSNSCSGPCAAGYTCPEGSTNNSVSRCPEGYYCAIGSGTPKICERGGYCPVMSGAPTLCPARSYNNSTGGKSVMDCAVCPAGKTCDVGTSTPLDCPIGHYCVAGENKEPCPAGTYCDDTGLSEPKSCPAGTYNPNTGSSKITDCLPCTAGTWSASQGEVGSCSQTCPAGSYCPSPNSMSIYQIPASTLSIYTGTASVPPAIMPINGRITIPIGTTQPVACPIGTYCPDAGTVRPTSCPVGTYSSLTGQTLSSACIPCQPGTYCPSPGAGSQTQCAPGTYCPLQGGSSPTQCPIAHICPVPSLVAATSCPPGQLCSTEGQIQPGAQCPPGTYSTGGAGSSCTACSTGYYGSGAGTTSQCSGLCPAGYYCPAGTSPLGGSSAPVPCPLGYYCPPGTQACPQGSTLTSGVCICPTGTTMISTGCVQTFIPANEHPGPCIFYNWSGGCMTYGPPQYSCGPGRIVAGNMCLIIPNT